MPPIPNDFRLYHSNDLEILAELLANELARPVPARPWLEPDTILIPQPTMRRWLQKTLAEKYGIAANLRFQTPGEFVRAALDANVPGLSETDVGDTATLRWRLWPHLANAGLMRADVFKDLHAVLSQGDPALSAWHLSGELAAAFEKYQAWRADWLLHWDRGGDRDDWQADCWRRATAGLSHRAKRMYAYLRRFHGDASDVPKGLPPRVFALACQNVSPDVLRVIASSARSGILHFYVVSPVQGWWGDLRSQRELLRDSPEAVYQDDEHPLLRANGIAGRDFFRLLFGYEAVHPSHEQGIYAPPDPETRLGLLHQMQRDLLTRQSPTAQREKTVLPAFDTAASDRSLRVHACHTRLREVQVLHEQLRDVLEHNPGMHPRDIAVLTPDIDGYAPYVHAVFGGEKSLPMPYSISDSSAQAALPLVEAFSRLLALPSARFTASEVLELLDLPAIAEHVGLDANTRDSVREWLQATGARWGLDASHRVALGAPEEPAYTWAWAIDRLLLGYATGNEDELAGVAPWPILEGSAIAAFNAVLLFLRKLAQCHLTLAKDHDASQWQVLLNKLLSDFFPKHPANTDERHALEFVQSLINQFARQTKLAGIETTIPASVLRAWFTSACSETDNRQPFLSGGISFGKMVPMRLIPFKVICLLGMDDGQYPRRDPIGSLNRLACELGSTKRQPGDRSIREDDRALFLQLFAAASDVFYISYLGWNPRSGESMPPAVVVSELLDVAMHYFSNEKIARDSFIVNHPLQPFSAKAYGKGDTRRVSYDNHWPPSAISNDISAQDEPVFATPLPSPTTTREHTIITRDSLDQALANPSREYLKQRLGLRLSKLDERLSDNEPFERDGLHAHRLKQRVFNTLVVSPDIDPITLARHLLAEGDIAPGAAGVLDVSQHMASQRAAVRQWNAWANGTVSPYPYEIQIGDSTLIGTFASVADSGLLQMSASKEHGRTQLALGLDALIWSALGNTKPIHRCVADKSKGSVFHIIDAMPTIPARAHLQRLITLANQARCAALPFMPKTGYAWFRRRDKNSDVALRSAHDEWMSDNGEGSDTWVQLALRGNFPFDNTASQQQFCELSLAVFSALPGLMANTESDHD